MDHVADLIAAFTHPSAADRQWETYDGQNALKIEIVQQLEELDDPRVLPFYLSVLADQNEYDLARIEILKVLAVKDCTVEEQRAIWPVAVQILMHGTDEVVRSYGAQALDTYQHIPQVVAAAESVVRDAQDDSNVRHAALDIVERLGPTEHAIALLRDLRSDREFAATANRLLKEWTIEGQSHERHSQA